VGCLLINFPFSLRATAWTAPQFHARNDERSGNFLGPILPAGTVLCTDRGNALPAAARYIEVEHHPINLSAGERLQSAWHVHNVNAFCSRLRAWMVRFKCVATKYLTNYLG